MIAPQSSSLSGLGHYPSGMVLLTHQPLFILTGWPCASSEMVRADRRVWHCSLWACPLTTLDRRPKYHGKSKALIMQTVPSLNQNYDREIKKEP